MVTPSTGWALLWTGNPAQPTPAALEVARTTDAGRTWTAVTPAAAVPALAGDTATLEAAGPQRAYLAVAGTTAHGTPASGQTEVFVTSNGGKSWRGSVPFAAADPQFVDFADPQHGWVLDNEGAAMQQNPVRLYRTVDGGLHWTLVAQSASSDVAPPSSSGLPVSCDKAGLVFRSAQTGWITGDCNALTVLVSSDAGARWTVQGLPVPPSACEQGGCYITGPHFFGATGFMTVADPPDPSFLLVSSDGGADWRVQSLPAVLTAAQVQFFSASSGIAITRTAPQGSFGRTFYITRDGGLHWSPVRQGRRFGSIASATFDFVSASAGFAWDPNASGPVPILYATSDSGRTWSRYEPTVQAG